MKKLLYLLLLTPIIYLVSCSSGKDGLTPEIEPIDEAIVGVTWQRTMIGGDWFRLNDDFTYSTKYYFCDTFEIEGVWELDGDVLINSYLIDGLQYTERRTILNYSDSLLNFQIDTTPNLDISIWFESVVPEPIRGCMDSTFLNFNPNAQCPDTCTNAPVYGCMDANALNYDATANIDDGSCCYVGGCMDATALNYNSNACQDDGSCCYVAGCMDNTAVNYNANACQDDGSCCYIGGCMDATALNYNSNACQDDGSCCFVAGCMDNTAVNYNANACQDDGSCIFIGDTYQGGILFYLDGNGGGLIASPSDQGQANWGCFGNDVPGADGIAIGTGYQNTIDIVNANCSPYSGNGSQLIAANLCANLTLGGYSDWYLPSKDELNEMYLNIGPGSPLGNIGNFSVNGQWSWYWTSTELNQGVVITQDFNSGTISDNNWDSKINTLLFRAIRAF